MNLPSFLKEDIKTKFFIILLCYYPCKNKYNSVIHKNIFTYILIIIHNIFFYYINILQYSCLNFFMNKFQKSNPLDIRIMRTSCFHYTINKDTKNIVKIINKKTHSQKVHCRLTRFVNSVAVVQGASQKDFETKF